MSDAESYSFIIGDDMVKDSFNSMRFSVIKKVHLISLAFIINLTYFIIIPAVVFPIIARISSGDIPLRRYKVVNVRHHNAKLKSHTSLLSFLYNSCRLGLNNPIPGQSCQLNNFLNVGIEFLIRDFLE